MTDFAELFGRPPAVTAGAPGRVNLMGEHTDYNGGFVLPTAIPQRTRVELAPRADARCQVWSDAPATGPELRQFDLGAEEPGRGWLDYVQGVTRLLAAEGHRIHGFDARVTSDVPLGSGLSSSASLTVSLMRALRSAFHLNLDDTALALAGQKVENQFVGARVGVMDPMAASLADGHTALYLDTRGLHYEKVPLPAGTDWVVINSGVAHNHAAGDYNTRRAECEHACVLLGVRQLRDLGADDLPRVLGLPEPLRRRARHVVTENDRVHAAVRALRSGDLQQLGRLFYASHASQRDDYEVSVPEVDLLVELSRSDGGVYGARLTGGGFGGSVVMAAHAGKGAAVARRIARLYAQHSGRTPVVLVPGRPAASP